MVAQQKQEIAFYINNIGQIGFYFSWVVKEGIGAVKIDFGNHTEGYITSGTEMFCTMSILALTPTVIKMLEIKLQVRS